MNCREVDERSSGPDAGAKGSFEADFQAYFLKIQYSKINVLVPQRIVGEDSLMTSFSLC